VAYSLQTGKKQNKTTLGCKITAQKVLFDNAVFAALMSGEKISRHTSKCTYFGFLKQSPLSNSNVVTEYSIENIHHLIMLSDVD
jgi:hypothetical protein